MTLANLLVDSMVFGLSLMVFGWAFDLIRSHLRHHAARLRGSDPFAGLGVWNGGATPHACGPHLTTLSTTARDRSAWPR